MSKPVPTVDFEIQAGYPLHTVVGADEVGRGCVAGPVVAGAIILPAVIDWERDSWLKSVADSKLLSEDERERLAPLISGWAFACAIGVATVAEIDEINIFHASHLAIVRAIQNLGVQPRHILIDGKFLPREGLMAPATAIVKGDQKCLSIAAASIVAKVWRDRHMADLDSKYPGYGLAKHKGYPTPAHSQALRKQGACEIHRRSFKTVSDLLSPPA